MRLIGFLAKCPPGRVSFESRSLYREYLHKVANSPLDHLMWIVFDHGYKIAQITRDEHVAYTYELLLSEDRTQKRMAEEAMQRTTGIYKTR